LHYFFEMISIPLSERNFVDLLQTGAVVSSLIVTPGAVFTYLLSFLKDDRGIFHDDPAFSVDIKDKVIVIILEQNCSRWQSI